MHIVKLSNYINSMKLHFKVNKKKQYIINVFFIVIVMIYLLPFWVDSVFKTDTELILDYALKIFHFEFLMVGPLTLSFIFIYSYMMFEKSILKYLCTIIYGFAYIFNIFISLFGILMVLQSDKEILSILPQIIMLVFIIICIYYDNKSKEYSKTYSINNTIILASVLLPLIFINIIGRIIFSMVG